MKQFLDFLPLIVFFTFYKMYDIFVASGALIAATMLTLIYAWVKLRQVATEKVTLKYFINAEKMAVTTFAMVAVFGTLTVIFHDATFLKWKVTVIYVLFALVLFISQVILKKPLIQRMLGKELTLPSQVWNNLNMAWALFFLLCGLANIYVAFWLSQDIWVNFKVFGLTALTLIFTLCSGLYIYRHIPQDQKIPEDQQK